MKKTLLIPLLLLSTCVQAQTLSASGYLNKLSKKLRGTNPTIQESLQMEEAEKAGQTELFLQKKISEYTQSADFRIKFKILVDEHFRLKTDHNPFKLSYTQVSPRGAYDFLVDEIIAQNKPWDSLLIAKNYTYEFYKYSNFEKTDRFFFQNILDIKTNLDLIQDINTPQQDLSSFITESVQFDGQDPRIAGVLSTRRFLDRFQNTALNKNRRRAAAVFRSFLCDSMVAAIPPKTNDSEKNDFDVLLPASTVSSTVESHTEEQLRKELPKADPHGTLPGCMACHYKLDPLGRTFALSASGLSHKASPGALVYKTPGNNVNIPVQGLAELAEKIVQQKEYVDCQVQTFWKWFIGQDVPKTEARHQELVEAFEKSERRPLNFIAYLVQTPEFKTAPEFLNENQILARKAAKLLKRCYDCHKDQDFNPIMKSWDLTAMPYAGTAEDRRSAIQQLTRAIDLFGDGSKRRMPPRDSAFQLSPDDFALLKNWVSEGAPDYTGKRQIP